MPPARRNLFAIAERLGMLVSELEERLTFSEYLGWIQFSGQDSSKDAPIDLTTLSQNDLKGMFGV